MLRLLINLRPHFKARLMTLCEILGPDERPRERLLEQGPETLTNAELLAIILGSGTRGQHAIAYARQLIDHFGGIRQLLHACPEALLALHGLGQAKVSTLVAIKEIGVRAALEQIKLGNVVTQPEQMKAFCLQKLSHLRVEHVMAIYLDGHNRFIDYEELSRGTLNQSLIYPREVVKSALKFHASAIVLAHNHPQGSSNPSQADVNLTHSLRDALSLVDVSLIDHLIVAGTQVISMLEMELM